jgi:hypothetical protein
MESALFPLEDKRKRVERIKTWHFMRMGRPVSRLLPVSRAGNASVYDGKLRRWAALSRCVLPTVGVVEK